MSRDRTSGKKPSNMFVRPPAKGKYRMVFFDIGYKNFAFAVEDFDLKDIQSVSPYTMDVFEDPIAKTYLKRKPKSQILDRKTILNRVYNNGESIECRNVSLLDEMTNRTNNHSGKQHFLNQELFFALTEYLDRYKYLWNTCNGFFVEEQVKFNPLAQRLEQHVYTYFTMNNPFQSTVIFPSPNKTKILCAPAYSKSERKRKLHKKWAITKAQQILIERGEQEYLINKILAVKGKKDDLLLLK